MRESSPSETFTRATDARPHAARDVRASVVRERAPAKPRAAESATPGHAAQAHVEEEAPAVGVAAKSAAPKQTSVPPELQLLAQAQRALRGSPSDALELTALHARAYPAGEFVEEREAIAVEALVALGNKAAARTRGRAFMSRYPSSAYASRVARLVEAIP
jgi:hypothetical protein